MKKRVVLLMSVMMTLSIVQGCSTQQEVSTKTTADKPVTSYTVKSETKNGSASYSAKAVPVRQSMLSFEVGGKIAHLAEEWSSVNHGEVIAALGQKDYELKLANAAAQVELARLQLELVEKGAREEEKGQLQKELETAKEALEKAKRDFEDAQKLADAGAIPVNTLKDLETNYLVAQKRVEQTELALSMAREGARTEEKEQVRKELDRARLGIEAAERELEKTELRAPFNGVLSMKMAELGEITGAGKPIFQLTQLNPIYMRMHADSSNISLFKEGISVEVYLPDTEISLEGIVSKQNPVADQMTGNYAVDILINNDKGSVRPGMVGEIRLKHEEKKSLWIPVSSLIRRGESNPYVFLLDSSTTTAKRREVETATLSGDWVEIKAGLKEGDIVIVRGAAQLTEGQKVKVMKEESGGRE